MDLQQFAQDIANMTGEDFDFVRDHLVVLKALKTKRFTGSRGAVVVWRKADGALAIKEQFLAADAAESNAQDEQENIQVTAIVEAFRNKVFVVPGDIGESFAAIENIQQRTVRTLSRKEVAERICEVFKFNIKYRDALHDLLPLFVARQKQVGDTLNPALILPFAFKDEAIGMRWCYVRLPFNEGDACEKPKMLETYTERMAYPDFFEQVMGGYLNRAMSRRQVVYLYGGGSDGKSELIKALRSVFPKHVTYAASVDNLVSDHGAVNLEGKFLVAIPEVNDSSFISSPRFKEMSGEDTMEVNPKGHELRNISLGCRFLTAGNDPPFVSGDNADLTRLAPVEIGALDEHSGSIEFKRQLQEQVLQFWQWFSFKFTEWRKTNPDKDIVPMPAELREEILATSKSAQASSLVEPYLEFVKDEQVKASELDRVMQTAFGPGSRVYGRVYKYLRSKAKKRRLSLGVAGQERGWVYVGIRMKGNALEIAESRRRGLRVDLE